MGSKSTVYGYIETHPNHDAHNNQIIQNTAFDDQYPFSDIFSLAREGYGASVISFAGSYKSLHEDWGEWEQRFELLLTSLFCFTARVHLRDDVDGELMVLEYVCDDGWDEDTEPKHRRWGKWRKSDDGTTSECEFRNG